MHRSGTGTRTRLLDLPGWALTGDLIGAADSNELGHRKFVAAVTLNDKMFETAGRGWKGCNRMIFNY
jgi:hypothetical protein